MAAALHSIPNDSREISFLFPKEEGNKGKRKLLVGRRHYRTDTHAKKKMAKKLTPCLQLIFFFYTALESGCLWLFVRDGQHTEEENWAEKGKIHVALAHIHTHDIEMRREEISLLVTHARCTAYPLSRRTDVDGRLVCARRSPQPAVVQQQQLCVDGFAALGANVIRARWFFSSLFYSNSNGPSAWPRDGRTDTRKKAVLVQGRQLGPPHVRPDILSSLTDSWPFLLKRKERKKFYLFRDWADYPSSAHVWLLFNSFEFDQIHVSCK